MLLLLRSPEETISKFQTLQSLFLDDYLYILLSPWVFKAGKPFSSLACQAHMMHPFLRLKQTDNARIDTKIRQNFISLMTEKYQIPWKRQASVISPFIKMTHIFENLYFCDSETASMYFTILLELVSSRSQIGFRILAHIFRRHKRHMIEVSTIFVREILKALNDVNLGLDKALVCETFCLVLTLAYLDQTEHTKNQIFSDAISKNMRLSEEAAAGKNFLFDFKNYKSFEVEIPEWMLRGGLVLRDYQFEGVKWMNFLWKYELNGILCDDMGLGKTLQSLVTVALQMLELNRPQNLTNSEWQEMKIEYQKVLSKSKREEILGQGKGQPILRQLSPLLSMSSKYQKWDKLTSTLALVICPNSLVYHWQKECNDKLSFGILTPTVLSRNLISKLQTRNLSTMLANSPLYPKLLISSYSFLKNNLEFFDIELGFIILDEAHMIKNEKTALAKAVKTLKSRRKLGLTGTPIQNNVLELWSIFDFAMPGYLGTKKAFRAQHRELMNMNLMSLELDKMKLTQVQRRILEYLHAKVLPFIMRREKKDVLKDLPPKIIQDYDCEMTDFQRRLYDIFTENELGFLPIENSETASRNEIGSENLKIDVRTDFRPEEKRNVLKTLNSLRKIVNHPFLVENDPLYANAITRAKKQMTKAQKQGYFLLSGKFVALERILESLGFEPNDVSSCILNANKMIIFSRLVASCEMIVQYLKRFFPFIKSLHLSSQLSLKDRANMVEEFNLDKTCKVIIMTPKIGGLGLNLASANIVLMFDHDFNPMNDLQAMDRAHRLGQKKCVNVFRLVTQSEILFSGFNNICRGFRFYIGEVYW